MNQYDLHVHTNASPCSRATPKEVVDAAMDANLDGIAITNHDTLEGYETVARLSPPSLTVVPGVEVTTTQGHLLALGVNTVPMRGPPLDVIDDIHDQGGVAVLSHPFDRFRQYYSEDLEEIARTVDGVETTNSRCVLRRFNKRAQSYAEGHDLGETGGSDAHFGIELGRAYTLCDGPLLNAIRTGTTQPGGRGGYLSGHVATKLNDALSMINR